MLIFSLQKQSKVPFMLEMGSIGSNFTNTTRWPFVSAGELYRSKLAPAQYNAIHFFRPPKNQTSAGLTPSQRFDITYWPNE